MGELIDLINELDENINLELNNRYSKDFEALRDKIIKLFEDISI